MKEKHKAYNKMIDSFEEQDWINIRKKLEEVLPEVKLWSDDLFKDYTTSVVRSGFSRKGLN